MSKWHIQEGFTLELSGEILAFYRDDEVVRFHIDEIDDVISALKRAKGYIEAEKIRQAEASALARWGKAKIPTEKDEFFTETADTWPLDEPIALAGRVLKPLKGAE